MAQFGNGFGGNCREIGDWSWRFIGFVSFKLEAGTAVLPRYEINEVNHIYLIYT